jgi:hypothetical protein
MGDKKRPILVAIIALLTLLAAFLVLLTAVLFLLTDIVVVTGIDFEVFGYGGLVGGLILLLIGTALWRGWAIAWYIGVIIYGLGALLCIASIVLVLMDGTINTEVAAGFALPLIICILILYYLFRPKVKEFFLS